MHSATTARCCTQPSQTAARWNRILDGLLHCSPEDPCNTVQLAYKLILERRTAEQTLTWSLLGELHPQYFSPDAVEMIAGGAACCTPR